MTFRGAITGGGGGEGVVSGKGPQVRGGLRVCEKGGGGG